METREIVVDRTFADFEDYWTTTVLAATLAPVVATLPANDAERLIARVRASTLADAGGRITARSRANAVKGRVP